MTSVRRSLPTASSSSEAEPSRVIGIIVGRGAPLVVLGEAIPLLAAVAAMPFLLAGLGAERLGLLSLLWVVIGYFSLFDLGMGRAITHLVASRLASGREADVARLMTAALAALVAVGAVAGVLLAGLSPWLIERALRVPADLRVEARRAFFILALTVPVVVATSGLRGALEAKQRFAVISGIRIGLGVLSFLGPLAVLQWSVSLTAIAGALALVRLAALALHLMVYRRVFPTPSGPPAVERGAIAELLRYGGWITISNLVSPLLVMLDRFVLGALVSVEAVAYYATPLEIVQRIGMIPIAISTVLFPTVAASSAGTAHRAGLLSLALRSSLVAVFPVLFLVAAFGGEALTLWLGPEFARQGSVILPWVAPALFLNAAGCASLFFLQAIGRPDVPARFHLLELALYLPLLFWLAARFGIRGAAMAWAARVSADAALLAYAASEEARLSRSFWRRVAGATAAALSATQLAPLPAISGPAVGARLALCAGAFAVLVGLLTSAAERREALDLLRAAARPRSTTTSRARGPRP